jgi:hypothetical protein
MKEEDIMPSDTQAPVSKKMLWAERILIFQSVHTNLFAIGQQRTFHTLAPLKLQERYGGWSDDSSRISRDFAIEIAKSLCVIEPAGPEIKRLPIGRPLASSAVHKGGYEK